MAPCGPGAIPLSLHFSTSPPSTLSFSIFYFSPFPFLLALSISLAGCCVDSKGKFFLFVMAPWGITYWISLFLVVISLGACPIGAPGRSALIHLLTLTLYKLFICVFTELFSFFTSFFPYAFFYLFTFLVVYFLPYLSTSSIIDPFRFQAGGCRRWPNLALVLCVNFILQYILLFMHACFCYVCFSFSVLSQEIGWEERLQSDLFCVGWDIKP